MAQFDYCALTGVDELMGYAIAYHFLKSFQNKDMKGKIRIKLFCQSRQHLEHLESMGGELVETDYHDQDQLDRELRGVQYLVFVPQMAKNAVLLGMNVLHAAAHCGVNYVAMVSCLGIGRAARGDGKRWPMHQQLYCLEQVMKRSFDEESYCIFQVPILAETFFFLTPMVQEQNKLRMPVDQDRKFAVLSLHDIVQGVYRLSVEQDTSSSSFVSRLAWIMNKQQKNQTLFQFTPRESENPSNMARHMAKGLEKGHDFSFDRIEPHDMREYLKRMREDHRFQQRLPIEETFAHPLASYLSDACIQGLLEAWDMADQGYLDKNTDDLERALGHPPQDLIHFFQSNRDSFDQLQ